MFVFANFHLDEFCVLSAIEGIKLRFPEDAKDNETPREDAVGLFFLFVPFLNECRVSISRGTWCHSKSRHEDEMFILEFSHSCRGHIRGLSK